MSPLTHLCSSRPELVTSCHPSRVWAFLSSCLWTSLPFVVSFRIRACMSCMSCMSSILYSLKAMLPIMHFWTEKSTIIEPDGPDFVLNSPQSCSSTPVSRLLSLVPCLSSPVPCLSSLVSQHDPHYPRERDPHYPREP